PGQPFRTAPAHAFAPTGIFHGAQKSDGRPILLPPRNMVVFGTSGTGKSHFLALATLSALALGLKIIAFDPRDEGKWIAAANPHCLVLHENFPWNPLAPVPYLTREEQGVLTTESFLKA